MKEIRTLTAEDIDVKVKQVTEKGAVLLLYKNARVDMNILDETFGSENWECDYKEIKGNLYCGIGVSENSGMAFVWKWDCGIESREDEGNEKKGEASDAFKRAGFKWGIGRELYTAPFIFVKVETVKDGSKYKLANPFEKFYVKTINYSAKTINQLVIIDSKGNVVYDMTSKSTYQTPQKTPTKEKPQETAPTDFIYECQNCGREITEKVAKYSKEKFGQELCFDCQKNQRNLDNGSLPF